ncbi:MAG TPA: DUF1801 domain-containing protein [Fluviicola sp.]|nr:DUF1801 domain-containing protein [Fluviicola sp.]
MSESPITAYFAQLDHPLKNVAERLRDLLLASHSSVGEQIKWNSPAFYYTGELKNADPKTYKGDLVVFHLRRKEEVLLIFPNGAKIVDPTGLLGGKFTDTRKSISYKSLEQVNADAKKLATVMNLLVEWVKDN